MATLRISVKHNASSIARELSDMADRIERVPEEAMPEALEILSESVRGTIESIAGGVYWDINSEVLSTKVGRVSTAPSKPHPIEPHGDYPLHFVIDGKDIFTRHVNHPGSNPVQWTLGVSQIAPDPIKSVFADRLEGAVRGITAGAMPQGAL